MNSGLTRLSFPILAVLGASISCGPSVRRNLGTIPQRQITFDDMCHLQDYFDQRNASRGAAAFRVVDEQSIETEQTEPDENGRMRRATLGEGTYIIGDRTARRRFGELIEAEYTKLPEMPLAGREDTVRVHVGWWASGQMRRLRPDRSIQVTTRTGVVTLPFNPCIGEFLFGGPVYALRRNVLDAEAARARGEIPALASPAPDTESTASDASTSPTDATATAPADATHDATSSP